MPLKIYQRKGSPNWFVRGAYLGKVVNQTTGTPKRAIAIQELKRIEEGIERGRHTKRGEPTFADAALAYVEAGGEKTYIRKLMEHFGETPLSQIDQGAIDAAAISLYPGQTAATRNRSVYTPTSAVLRGAGVGLNLRRPRGASGKHQTSWLWPEQTEALFEAAQALNPDFAALLIVLTYTGMRLSEALNLEWNDVRLEDGYAYVPDTKNGEPRAVFLPPVAVAALGNMDGREGRIFRLSKGGHIYSLLKAAAFKAGVNLPERQSFHLLRHTWATWMMKYAGLNTKQLVGTGAWKDTKSAERYAHTVITDEARRAVLLPTPKAKKS